MATQVQWRGGSTTEHATFTGAAREITVDTQKQTLVLHDGSTAGGRPLLRQDLSNLPAGTIDDADVNASAAIAGTKISPNFGSQTITTTGVFSHALGAVGTPSITFTGDLNTGFWSPTADTIAASTGGAERLRITSAGNVGIATTTPEANAKLTVYGAGIAISKTSDTVTPSTFDLKIRSADPKIGLHVTNTAQTATLEFGTAGDNANGAFINVTGADPLRFGVNNTETARIDSSGRLLVGTSSARTLGSMASALEVEGTSFSGSSISITNNENTANGAFLNFGKSRGASLGSNTIVNSGDNIAHLIFHGANGSGTNVAAAIDVQVDGTPGVNDMPGRLVFSTTADGAASPTERMRINSNGTLFVVAGAAVTCQVNSTTAAAGTVQSFFIGRHTGTAGAIDSGTASVYIYTNGNIQNTNNSYTGISDIKLKENIVDANSQWDDLKALQVRNYNFKEETGHQTHTQIGLIAQEVELVSPGLLNESPDRDADGSDLGTVTKSVNYSVLYMKAVKALQEAIERIEQLETSNTDLLARVIALETA